MAVKVKHNKTGNGTHQERVNMYKAQLKAQRRAADFLQGKRDLLAQVPMLTDGSKYEVTVVDGQAQPKAISGNNASLSLGSSGTGSVGLPLEEKEELIDVFDPANASKFQFKMSGTGIVGLPGEVLLTEEQALEEVDSMSRNYDQP